MIFTNSVKLIVNTCLNLKEFFNLIMSVSLCTSTFVKEFVWVFKIRQSVYPTLHLLSSPAFCGSICFMPQSFFYELSIRQSVQLPIPFQTSPSSNFHQEDRMTRTINFTSYHCNLYIHSLLLQSRRRKFYRDIQIYYTFNIFKFNSDRLLHTLIHTFKHRYMTYKKSNFVR